MEMIKDVTRKIDFDTSVTWSIIDWLHSITTLPIIVKGILTGKSPGKSILGAQKEI